MTMEEQVASLKRVAAEQLRKGEAERDEWFLGFAAGLLLAVRLLGRTKEVQ